MSDEKREFHLDRWDADIKPWKTLAIFAPRGGGKSYCIRDLLYKNQHKFPSVIVICPSEKVNNFYKTIIPDAFIYDDLDADAIKAIDQAFARQKSLLKELPPWMSSAEDATCLIIMDDCMASEKKYLNHLKVKELYKNGRHFKFALWVVVQYFNDLASDLRLNLDYSIILKSTDVKMQQKYLDFLGDENFGNKYDFAKIMKHYTDKFGCIIKDTTRGSNDFNKMFFKYKADPVPDNWKMNPDQWAFAACHYVDPDSHVEKIDYEDTASIIAKCAANTTAVAVPAKGRSKKAEKSAIIIVDRDKDGEIIDNA